MAVPAIENYTDVLADLERRHAALIEEANQRLKTLSREAEAQMSALQTSSQRRPHPSHRPQMAWVTGNDGERFMMLNEEAVNLINGVIDGIKGVVALLAEQEKAEIAKRKRR